MKVNIERAIKSISETISFYQPLYEGIVNSFQAGADNLNIRFETQEDFITGYSIEDDGEGFTDDNIESFLTLWSDHNIKKGALGSGRILCLKIFDNIQIESQTKNHRDNKGQKVNIDFHKKFAANTIDDIAPEKKDSKKSYTKTKFKNINEEYQDKQEPYSLDDIKNNIFLQLLPMFIHFHKEKRSFTIQINGKLWLNNENLEQQFTEQEFKIKSFNITKDFASFEKGERASDEQIFEFTLHYRIVKDNKKILEQFYGAADRYIMSFPKGIKLEKLDDQYSGTFCLTSTYLDTRVKDSRNAFVITFNQSNSTKENPITFPEINKKLSMLLIEILKENFPNVEASFEEKQKNIVDRFPHLYRYVKKINNLTISESELQKMAESDFLKESKQIRSDVERFTSEVRKKKNFNEEAYQKIAQNFTQVGMEQLADYIGYRQTIIEMLLEISEETLADKNKFKEEDIHNLFFPLGETSDTSFLYANNIWIFDDKFMSYNYAASDITVKKIVKSVQEPLGHCDIPKHHKEKKPDLVIFYSTPNDNEYKDVLLIEFKRLNSSIDDKEKAINQLNRYPKYIRENISNIRSIFTYTIIDIDKEFSESLKDIQGFSENAFGDEDNKINAYYKYNPNVKAHINVISFKQVLLDADKRNKVFLDILKQNFRID